MRILALLASTIVSVAACDESLLGPMSPGSPPRDPPGDEPPPAGTPADTTGCGYPAAPLLKDARFAVGTVVPNLTFRREDGSELTFKDIRCDKRNRLLVWLIGGDQCEPCIATAKLQEIPAWRALGSQGMFLLEGFNGDGQLVSDDPFNGWRQLTGWPPDGDGIALVQEPKTRPRYVVGRVLQGIPRNYFIDLETMKVLVVEARVSIPTITMRLARLPPRQ